MALFDDARLGRNDPGFQSQPSAQQRGAISRRPTPGFEGTNLSGLNLFNATGEIRPSGNTEPTNQQISPGRLDPLSSFFENPLHDALDFLSSGNTSGRTLNQLRGAGVDPFAAPVAQLAQAEPGLGGAAGFDQGFEGIGAGVTYDEAGNPIFTHPPNRGGAGGINAAVTQGSNQFGGGVQQNTGGLQQGAAVDGSLEAFIINLLQSLLVSGQFAAGGGVGQQQGQPVFRSDLNRLGRNQF